MRAGRRDPIISHLMFADNLLFFGVATMNQMKVVLECLEKLCNMSRQKASIQKNKSFLL